MDSTYRNDVLRSVHPDVMSRCVLGDIDREYTLNEICIITRAGPAKILGLKHKGHLGVGADADITIYSPHENKEVMFEMPRYVIKSGEILIDECELKQQTFGKTLHVAPAYDVEVEADIADWFEQYYTVQFRNYPISDDYLHDSELVDCNEEES
jgi:formylmethanofuran dehydrogenase subunit A